MTKILVGIIGNGREELLSQTILSAYENLDFASISDVGWVLVDDTGNNVYQDMLAEKYSPWFDAYRFHFENKGLSGSVRTLWEYAIQKNYDYIFHLEEDFTFNEMIDVEQMIWTLTHGHEEMKVAQMALKRQPCNPAEAEAGGFMQQNPKSYTLHNVGEPHLTHRNFFTLNPSVYPVSLCRELPWQKGWGEKEYSELLFGSSDRIFCGYMGKIDDPPLVTHIGGYRAEGWKV